MEQDLEDILQRGGELYHPGFSIDCAIFGFHANQLKVLLLKVKNTGRWALPGGFMLKNEDVETAAARLLKARTGLEHVFLRQFYLFGDLARNDEAFNRQRLRKENIQASAEHWFLQRFLTLGYYALVDFAQAVPRPDYISEDCAWWDLHEVPALMLDHNRILDKALETLRLQLTYQPIGYNLLPEKFTMTELQCLYETILGRKLDRRNFLRRIQSYGILRRLDERRDGVAHKPPYLYRFDLPAYEQALRQGLNGAW
ncbi:NUDIX hydrolase [Nibrella saemangeumensis]|uniref:NUDIX hydrolase n=1 Tax=Nibrella saemangeumensis TaxID=1084526 RepID=UPI0031EAC50D